MQYALNPTDGPLALGLMLDIIRQAKEGGIDTRSLALAMIVAGCDELVNAGCPEAASAVFKGQTQIIDLMLATTEGQH